MQKPAAMVDSLYTQSYFTDRKGETDETSATK